MFTFIPGSKPEVFPFTLIKEFFQEHLLHDIASVWVAVVTPRFRLKVELDAVCRKCFVPHMEHSSQ